MRPYLTYLLATCGVAAASAIRRSHPLSHEITPSITSTKPLASSAVPFEAWANDDDGSAHDAADQAFHKHDAKWSQVMEQLGFEGAYRTAETSGHDITALPAPTATANVEDVDSDVFDAPVTGHEEDIQGETLEWETDVSTSRTWTPPWYEEEPSWHPSTATTTQDLQHPAHTHVSVTSFPNASISETPTFMNYSATLPRYWNHTTTSTPRASWTPSLNLPIGGWNNTYRNISSSLVPTSTIIRAMNTTAPRAVWIWREDAMPSPVAVNVTVTKTLQGSKTTVTVIPMVSASFPPVPLINSLSELRANETDVNSTANNPKAIFTPEQYDQVQEGIANLDPSYILPPEKAGDCQPLPDDPCVNATAIFQDDKMAQLIEEKDQQDQEQNADHHDEDHHDKGHHDKDHHRRKHLATILGTSLGLGLGIPASAALSFGVLQNERQLLLGLGGLMKSRLPASLVWNLDKRLPLGLIQALNLPRMETPTVLASNEPANPGHFYTPQNWPFRTPQGLPVVGTYGTPGSPPLPGAPLIPPEAAPFPPTPVPPFLAPVIEPPIPGGPKLPEDKYLPPSREPPPMPKNDLPVYTIPPLDIGEPLFEGLEFPEYFVPKLPLWPITQEEYEAWEAAQMDEATIQRKKYERRIRITALRYKSWLEDMYKKLDTNGPPYKAGPGREHRNSLNDMARLSALVDHKLNELAHTTEQVSSCRASLASASSSCHANSPSVPKPPHGSPDLDQALGDLKQCRSSSESLKTLNSEQREVLAQAEEGLAWYRAQIGNAKSTLGKEPIPE